MPCVFSRNGCIDKDSTCHGGGRPFRYIVLHEDRGPLPQNKPQPPFFGQTTGCIDMPVGMQIDLGWSDTVLHGDPAPTSHPKKRSTTSHKFSAHVYCSQMPVCISIPLGTEIELSLDDIVLDGNVPPLPLKAHNPLTFRPCFLWPKGCMDQDTTGYKGKPKPMSTHYCSPLLWNEHNNPSLFDPCLWWPWSLISATAQLFSTYRAVHSTTVKQHINPSHVHSTKNISVIVILYCLWSSLHKYVWNTLSRFINNLYNSAIAIYNRWRMHYIISLY